MSSASPTSFGTQDTAASDRPPDLVVWATAAVAVYGALLASYNAWLSQQRERRDRERHRIEQAREERRVLVRAGPVVIPDRPGLRAVGVRVVNTGRGRSP
jgi:hypothetical protein